jgi:ribosomal protein L11 methyltransferase
MGFGTGHHATTRLMLRAMQKMPLENQTVLDIGCGSGVLAIAAVTLGAQSAVGIDNDPDALENARENAALNKTGDRVRFEEGDFREMPLHANVVMANLTHGLLERSAQQLTAMTAPAGVLIVSGFMEIEKASVITALEKFLALQTIAQEEEWMCGVFAGPT